MNNPPQINLETIEATEALKTAHDTVEENFPTRWIETEICLSAIACLRLADLVDPPTIFLTGAPSSEKTTILSFFYGNKNVYKSDNFTPKSFVSHATNTKLETLKKIDLLPKLRNKVFCTPELAPLLKKPKEQLLENFAILARVLDGEGYESDSGARGKRGYTGKYVFAWLGATTPLSKPAWNIMSGIGHRILFVKMDCSEKNVSEYQKMFLESDSYKEKIEKTRPPIQALVSHLFEKGLYNVEWKRENDKADFKHIVETALLVARLRAGVSIWSEKTEEGETAHNFSTSEIEKPERLITHLYNLARGRALLHGRSSINMEDVHMVWRVGFSSMPFDRSIFFLHLIKNAGKLTTEQVEKALNCTKATARKIMHTFTILKVVNADTESNSTPGQPMQSISLKKRFSWVLEQETIKGLFEELREKEPENNSHSVENAKSIPDNNYSKITPADVWQKSLFGTKRKCHNCPDSKLKEVSVWNSAGDFHLCTECWEKENSKEQVVV